MRKLVILGVILGVIAGIAYYAKVTPDDIQQYLSKLTGVGGHSESAHQEVKAAVPKRPHGPNELVVDSDQQRTIGMQIVKVIAQDAPIDLELLGETGYDEAQLVKIRPRFDTLVQKVHVSTGQQVKAGDALVDLYSTELAEAKNQYRLKQLKWVLAHRMLEARRDLVAGGAISKVLWVETQNTENETRLERDVAADKLSILGLAKPEIATLILNLTAEGLERLAETDLASMTLRAPVAGIIIDRDVVPQNLYNETNVLMTIAPLDHLYVWGNVYESDLDKVHVGQPWVIKFPYLKESIESKVEYVSNRVDPQSHSIRIRASIPNREGKFKAAMLVRAILKIAPLAGHTIVPRQAVVTLNGDNFVFVAKEPVHDIFLRRKVRVELERFDHVVIADGIEPGDHVVTSGSLILAQLFEDQEGLDGDANPAPSDETPKPAVAEAISATSSSIVKP